MTTIERLLALLAVIFAFLVSVITADPFTFGLGLAEAIGAIGLTFLVLDEGRHVFDDEDED